MHKNNPDLKIVCHHSYLEVARHIGYPVYQAISEKSWAAECVYAALLYPDRTVEIGKRFRYLVKGVPELRHLEFSAFIDEVAEISNGIIRGINWSEFRLIGFSVCLCQLASTRYFIQEIRKITTDVPIVVGGSLITGMTEPDVRQMFPGTDYIIQGEGELPLERLVHGITEDRMGLENGPMTDSRPCRSPSISQGQVEDLGALPVPDFLDYFCLLDGFPPDRKFFPTLPVEFSRGCWWHRLDSEGRPHGCAFCNLNAQWHGYRKKQPSQVVHEIDALTRHHRTLSIAVMDNVLPARGTADYFSGISSLEKELHIFCELRAKASKKILEQMGSAGVDNVQVGIEALSSRLLKKLNKGTTAIQNIQMMRDLEELRIKNGANLMIQFPGSDGADVEETLRHLPFVLPFYPLNIVRFQLGMGSPVALNPEAFGIVSHGNHPNYSYLFPSSVCSTVRFPQMAYRGNIAYQKTLWRPVLKEVGLWGKTYRNLHKEPGWDPILSYMHGRTFILIRQRLNHGRTNTHRLEGMSARIYLFCTQNRSLRRIKREFDAISLEKIVAFLHMMVNKKLMFHEDDRYLSLAVSRRRGGPA